MNGFANCAPDLTTSLSLLGCAAVGILLYGTPVRSRAIGQPSRIQKPFRDEQNEQTQEASVVIVGGAAAGLSAASCLQAEGISCIVLEKFPRSGEIWRSRYHRLHLHDIIDECHLPHFPMPDSFPTYPTRQQFASYLDSYRQAQQIDVRFQHEVTRIERTKSGEDWVIYATDNSQQPSKTIEFRASQVVIANGIYNQPKIPSIPGLESFPGLAVHSSAYTNGSDLNLKGKNVLVIGFGNSGAEILIDLVVF